MPNAPQALNTARSGTSRAGTARNAWIDHLRVGLTFLVILHHVAIAYGGSGGWYWKELPDASNPLLVLFNATNQSFFMGFFFLLAGYYTPPAWERKGARQFLTDRAARLGIPLAGYFFVLSPLTIALAGSASGEGFVSRLVRVYQERDFEPGPLWFAEALLLFALAYAGWSLIAPRRASVGAGRVRSRHPWIVAAVLLVGVANAVVRLWIPVGQSLFALQLGYFPAYVLLFAVGCAAADSRRLESVSAREAAPWGGLSLLLIFVLPAVLARASDLGQFVGGLNPFALFYAFWDPLVGAGIILSLLYLGRRFLTGESAVMAWLARRAFGIFILHPPMVVGLSLLLRGWPAAGVWKFAGVGALSCIVTALAADLLLRLPGARRVL